MRSIVLLLLATLAACGVWLLTRPRSVVVTPYEDAAPTTPVVGPQPSILATGMHSELASGPTRPGPAKTERAPGLTVVKYGAAVVTLVAPAGVSVPKSLSFDVAPLDFTHAQKAIPLEQEDGSWKYDELPVGRWRIRAFVPGFADASKVVEIRPNGETAVSMPLEVGGAASWKVALTTGAAPDLVRVLLLDGRGVSLEGTYQTAATTLHAAPSDVPALPSEGRVVGLRVGRYRLRAATVDGPSKEEPFEVKAGETTALEFTFSR